MNKPDKTFRDELLNIEQPNINYKEKYERQVKEMFEKKLTGINKWAHIGGLIMGIGFAVLFGTVAVVIPKEFPLWGRSIFALGAVFGLLIIGLEGWILKKGTINLMQDNMAMAGLAWAFIVILATIVLVFSGKLPDRIVGVHMLAYVLVFEVMAAVGLIRAFIERSELKTREKLLEIEYHIAELTEKIEGLKG